MKRRKSTKTQQRQRVSKLVLLVTLCALSSLGNAAKFYRWTDPAGKVHYSYTPPPTTQVSYTKINGSGRHIEKVDNEDEPHNELDKVPEKKPDTEKEIINKQYDNYLLASYLNVTELTTASQKKQSLLTEQITSYKARIEKLKQSVSKTKDQEAKAKNKKAKAKLQDYIEATTDSINIYKEIITESLTKIEKIKQRYITDKVRLTELLSKESKNKAE